jgi:type VI secretion system protein VasG
MDVNFLKSLIGKLDATCRDALHAAAARGFTNRNYEVEIEHLLLKLLEATNTDIERVLRHFEINQGRVINDVTTALAQLKTGNTRTPDFSPRLPRLFQEAWLLASVEYGADSVRSGHLLLALLTDESLARLAPRISDEFKRISVETLKKNFQDITAGSAEEREAAASRSAAASGAQGGDGASSPDGAPAGRKAKALDQFTIDLTARAREGKIDPVLGRDFEIRQVVDILTRRRQKIGRAHV